MANTSFWITIEEQEIGPLYVQELLAGGDPKIYMEAQDGESWSSAVHQMNWASENISIIHPAKFNKDGGLVSTGLACINQPTEDDFVKLLRKSRTYSGSPVTISPNKLSHDERAIDEILCPPWGQHDKLEDTDRCARLGAKWLFYAGHDKKRMTSVLLFEDLADAYSCLASARTSKGTKLIAASPSQWNRIRDHWNSLPDPPWDL